MPRISRVNYGKMNMSSVLLVVTRLISTSVIVSTTAYYSEDFQISIGMLRKREPFQERIANRRKRPKLKEKKTGKDYTLALYN